MTFYTRRRRTSEYITWAVPMVLEHLIASQSHAEDITEESCDTNPIPSSLTPYILPCGNFNANLNPRLRQLILDRALKHSRRLLIRDLAQELGLQRAG